MNRADELEQQLRSARPAAPSTDEASVLYACGYAAGRQSALNEAANGTSWWKVAAAVLLVGALSGSGGYGMARRAMTKTPLASAPKVTIPPPASMTDTMTGPESRTIMDVGEAESDQNAEPTPKPSAPRAAFSLSELLIFSRSPIATGELGGVVLTARSGSDEWTRWMAETPADRERRRTNTTSQSVPAAAGAVTGTELTPMYWRRGDSHWEQWIH